MVGGVIDIRVVKAVLYIFYSLLSRYELCHSNKRVNRVEMTTSSLCRLLSEFRILIIIRMRNRLI